MKLPLDMSTVRQVLAIAQELQRRGELSESNLIAGLVFAAISDTKWFGSGLQDWVTLWNPAKPGTITDPEIDIGGVLVPVANQLLQSGRRSQAARLFAVVASLWPGLDWLQIGQAGMKGFIPKPPETESQRFQGREEQLKRLTQIKDLSPTMTIMNMLDSSGIGKGARISYAEQYAESLPSKEPLLLTGAEEEAVANAVYDFRWSGRPESAVRLSTVLPQAVERSDVYERVLEHSGSRLLAAEPHLAQTAKIALGLKSKGYSAEGLNLYLDSLNLEDNSPEWNHLFKIVEPAVQGATVKSTRPVYSWARGIASRLSNDSPTAGGPPSTDLTIPANASLPPDTNKQTADGADPPRSAYALLKCDDAVIADREFTLTVGLADAPDPAIAGDQELERPASSVGPYQLQIQITADGFHLRNGESWRNELPVTFDEPYPSLTLHLIPEMQSNKNIWPRIITAVYSVDGHSIGVAMRSVAIVRDEEYLQQATTPAQEPSATFAIPTDKEPPDLTVSIVYGASPGRLLWTLISPWKEVKLPTDPIVVDVGGNADAKDYARKLVDSVNAHEGKDTLYKHLLGRGREVGDLVPAAFWDALRAVTEESTHKLPTVLLLSAEPYIPWELAVLEPPLNPALPPFLGAQAIVGRWVLANRRPKPLPPLEQRVTAIAVVSGVYNRLPGWRPLVQAEQEARDIQTKWNGIPVNAETVPVLECIDGTPPGDLLHFALHGIYDPDSTLNGLVLVDGQTLDPTTVKGSNLTHTPFVFLNACQVGSSNRVLGDYAGMAAAFLYAGASGVVAPLWSIKDTIARDIALRFYDQAFNGKAPAEFLRSERSKFTNPPKENSATCLAYQYFGHPAMRLVRQSINTT